MERLRTRYRREHSRSSALIPLYHIAVFGRDLYKHQSLKLFVKKPPKNGTSKNGTSKIYCERCDLVFDSREEFDRHFDRHSGIVCETCPIDTAIAKFLNLFKR